jgi:hypothetical protein
MIHIVSGVSVGDVVMLAPPVKEEKSERPRIDAEKPPPDDKPGGDEKPPADSAVRSPHDHHLPQSGRAVAPRPPTPRNPAGRLPRNRRPPPSSTEPVKATDGQ